MTPTSSARGLAAVTLAVAGAVAAWATPASAQVAPAADGCDAGAGVRVVLDPGPLDGDVVVRCVADGADQAVGAVTEEAGVAITWVQRYPGAFVCRLDDRPADLPCADTPPGDRYWGLFVAAPGARSWTYASQGAGSLTVPAGGVVGWRLQDGAELEPPAYRPAARPAARSAGPDDATAPAAPSQSSPESPESPETPDADAGGGSTALVGAALLAGLGAAGVLVARRRRT